MAAANGESDKSPAEGGKTRLVGDVDYAGVAEVAGAITPVPGGVGPMTIAVLLRNEDRIAQIRQTWHDERTSAEERRQLTRESLVLQESLRDTVEAKRAALESFLADLDTRIIKGRRFLAEQENLVS